MSGTIEVEDIRSMYRFIRDKRCVCGGKLQITKQRKIGKNREIITANCTSCKKATGFVFKLKG
ncbi:MAG: hypothetical protein ACTSP4_16765 [Candidatus Hodarchaeales archaeon]